MMIGFLACTQRDSLLFSLCFLGSRDHGLHLIASITGAPRLSPCLSASPMIGRTVAQGGFELVNALLVPHGPRLLVYKY